MKYFDQQPGLYSLQKGWRFREAALSDIPEENGHHTIYSYAKGDGARGPAGCIYDDADWEEIQLPHDWVTQKDFDKSALTGANHGYKERGHGWYRLHFALNPEDRGKQILLEFEGMSRDARIYINGSHVYTNLSGYHPFSIDITDMAIFDIRGNVLAIEIDASTWEGWWYEGAGIYRNAWLIKKNKLHIEYDGVYVHPEQTSDGWITTVEADIANSLAGTEQAAVQVRLLNPEGQVISTASQDLSLDGYHNTTVTFRLPADTVRLWDLDTPIRYRCEVSILQNNQVVDYLKVYYGYRTLRFDPDTGFYLNDRNIKLKGFCNHQDHAGVGVAVPYAIKEYRVGLLKELGANAYRCAHNTDPEIQEICDRLGMLVMEENRSFRTSEEVLRQLRGMVRKARNHPSVAMYSVFNEEPLQGTEQGARLAARLRAEIRKLDASRPVLGAFNGGYLEEAGASGVLDVTGMNYNTSLYDAFHEKYPDRPLVGSETVSAFMVRGEYETDASRNTIASYDDDCAPWGNTVRDGWKQVAERPFVAGTFVWTGFDYRGEPTPYTWPSVATFFGTYDSCGFPKDCCYLYKAFWKDEPLLHLLPDWDRPLDTGTPVKVMAFTNCDEAEIFINGKSQGRKACDPYDQVSWEVPYEMGTLSAKGYRNGELAAEDQQVTPGVMTAIRLTASKDTMAYDGQDAIAINAEAIDAFGNFVPSADTLIFFETEGGAEIIGVGNGDPNSHEPDAIYYRHMFHGRCQAIIRNCDGADVTVKAYAQHMDGDQVFITTYEVPVIPNVDIVHEECISDWRMYSSLFDNMPEPNPAVSEQDMNSYEPVIFDGTSQAIFQNQPGCYGLYRTEYDFGFGGAGRLLFCSQILGKVQLYVDGEPLGETMSEIIALDLPESLTGRHVLTMILQRDNAYLGHAGILQPLVIRK